jgi:hypothetical protein
MNCFFWIAIILLLAELVLLLALLGLWLAVELADHYEKNDPGT